MRRSFDSVMVRTLLRPLVATTQLFALYALVHGHYSPGGGFQAGVLFASAMILPMLVLGRGQPPPRGIIVLGPRGALSMAAVGVLLYLLTGLVSTMQGETFLDYSYLPLPLEASMRDSMGILLIEIGVTLGVGGASVSIFHSLYRESSEGETP